MMLFLNKPSPTAAIWSMLVGGCSTLLLMAIHFQLPFGLDPIVAGISLSFLVFILVQQTQKRKVLGVRS
jgi:SSS family solute:Na+ symporter